MTVSAEQLHRLADELFRAFERNDPAGVGACCEDDAVFRRNGRRSGLARELLPSIATLRERIGPHRYTDVRREVFANGFVEEHRVETVLPSGEPMEVVACVVARVGETGLVKELSEYVGSPFGRSSRSG